MKNRLSLLTVFFSICLGLLGNAQPLEQAIKIIISPNHADWIYKIGEQASFTVSVLQNSIPVKDVKINYQVGPERMKPTLQQSTRLPKGRLLIEGGTLKAPGFLRCVVIAEVDGKKYRNLATAGYDILNIKPGVEKPVDFDEFWNKAKNELAEIPMDVKMVLLKDKCSALSNVYEVNLQNFGNSRLFGILCVPKKAGKYPAILQVPGAGIRPYNPDLEMADKGIIVFTIGIHGIPVTMDISVYNSLETSALKGYFFFNPDNKDRYYYKRVYLGCIRANDFLTALPEFDGTHLAVSGNSQGGTLSIVTASLDSRVKYLAAIHPAFCDLTGYFKGHAGGWPHFFNEINLPYYNTKEVINALSYYDVVNFARSLKTEGYYTWGFNDETCPPTSMYAAFNIIAAPKTNVIYQETGHWIYPEEKAKFNDWLIRKINKE